MQFLPIADRELRVAAHQPRTWGRRVMTTGVGLALLAFVLAVLGQWRGLLLIGRELFGALSWMGMIYALLAGPLTTADCLSRERRDGTLGLLFLTDLRSYDVVLGKMAAACLWMIFDLTAVLPIAAIPMLMGGVSLAQLGLVALSLVNITFMSLAVGACASALPRSGRSSLALTLGVLFFLTAGVPMLGDLFGIKPPAEPWFFMLSPIHVMSKAVGGLLVKHRWEYWLNMGAMHAFAWGCLAVAIWRTRTSWRDLTLSAPAQRRRERFERWRQGSAASRRRWRTLMLNKHPVAWLEGRDRLQARALWAILLSVAIAVAGTHVLYPTEFPDEDWVFGWAIFAHYILCFWIAIQAPRRLADDKESGALELLLCTPIKPGAIVRGCMIVLWRRFGRGFGVLVLLDVFFALLFFSEHGGWEKFWSGPIWRIAACVLVVAPVQTYSLARIGVYQGLAQTNSLRATFMTAWNAGILPWITWFAVMLSLETSRRYLRVPANISDDAAFGAWAGVHVLVCLLCVAQASWRLRWRFRYLAAKPAGMQWWKAWRIRWRSTGASELPTILQSRRPARGLSAGGGAPGDA